MHSCWNILPWSLFLVYTFLFIYLWGLLWLLSIYEFHVNTMDSSKIKEKELKINYNNPFEVWSIMKL
jgi:hypothetical protein